MKFPNISNHPGYTSAFTTECAEGAIPNGSTVIKCNSVEGDMNPDGTSGVVLGSFKSPEQLSALGVKFMYFIEWSTAPGTAVAAVDKKLSRPS